MHRQAANHTAVLGKGYKAQLGTGVEQQCVVDGYRANIRPGSPIVNGILPGALPCGGRIGTDGQAGQRVAVQISEVGGE